MDASLAAVEIAAIEYALAPGKLTNADLAGEHPDWSMEQIENSTGIAVRRVAAPHQCASDLAFEAAEKLFASQACERADIDFVLFCTQMPDYILPTTACLLQHRLGLPTAAGALDFNLGCSGFVYGLSLATGLIASRQARNILLLTGETYTKLIHPDDRSTRTIFSDAGAAALVRASTAASGMGPFVFGADGSGGDNLCVKHGGARHPVAADNGDAKPRLTMNGPEVFRFTLETVPQAATALLDRAQTKMEDVDLVVFHQANAFILEHLRRKIGFSKSQFYVSLKDVGNTASCSIPIALKHALDEGSLKPGHRVMLVGFGMGYSWAAGMLHWT